MARCAMGVALDAEQNTSRPSLRLYDGVIMARWWAQSGDIVKEEHLCSEVVQFAPSQPKI